MSVLIDKFVAEHDIDCNIKINGLWYIAASLEHFNYKTVISRFKDAIRIIKGTSFAVHYKEKE